MNLSYRTALLLRDAGFPQRLDELIAAEDVNPRSAIRRPNHRTFDESMMNYPKTEPDYYEQGKWRASCIFARAWLESDEAETVLFPSLAELIAACGDGFGNLERVKMPSGMLNWIALEPRNKQTIAFMSAQDTPEEAVAHLWLALNKPHEKA